MFGADGAVVVWMCVRVWVGVCGALGVFVGACVIAHCVCVRGCVCDCVCTPVCVCVCMCVCVCECVCVCVYTTPKQTAEALSEQYIQHTAAAPANYASRSHSYRARAPASPLYHVSPSGRSTLKLKGIKIQ